ncbi:MAG: hypothetical protein BWK79_17680 [Beggiatoa sp. IS2]|nr:MAG: hypothetical protein BWK79_17680 [Beggiatoa sp. IS2]
MDILGRGLVTEQMPDGWVICEKYLDGVLNIVVDDVFSSEKAANRKLQSLMVSLLNKYQQLNAKAEKYWQINH